MSIPDLRSPRPLHALVLLLAGCAVPPVLPVSTTPLSSVVLRSETYAGSPLSGPLDASQLPAELDAWVAVDIELTHLDRFPRDVLDALARRSGLIARPGAAEVIRSLHVDPTETRLGSGEAAEQFLDEVLAGRHGKHRVLARGRTALAPGTTFCLMGGTADEPPPVPGHGSLPLPSNVGEIELHRPRLGSDGAEGKLRLTLVHAVSLSDPNGRDRESSRLLVSLEPWNGGEQTIVVVTPTSRLPGSLMATYRLHPGDDSPLHAAAVSSARQQARLALQTPGRIATPRTPDEVLLATTLAGLSGWRTRQQALLLLAEHTGADFALDLLLWNRRDLAERLADALLAQHPLGQDSSSLGWQLERSAYRLVAELASDSIPLAEAESLLARHAGETGRHPAVLEEVLDRSDDLAWFRRRILRTNFIYLEDSTPASRVRAFDWLAGQGAAPDGFDPLGSRRERSRILADTELPGLP